MANTLSTYFPLIRTREEILEEISEKKELLSLFENWSPDQQEEFLDFCSGNRGVKILYDPFFKEIMDPDSTPERLEELLSLLLGQQVRILKVLPNDSTRITAEGSLVIMDIVIEMEDHSIANVEVQKMGYMFPGERAACYSSDLLLRQYKRVRGEKEKPFSYRNIRPVYTIVFYEQSPKEFHDYPDDYTHNFAQASDTGIKLNLLQEYTFVPLDIFLKILHNNGIRNKLEAWLAFLSCDEPEMILKLIQEYPQFRRYYDEIYELCRNTEKVINMFSKELQELDRNTVQYMIDEMQAEIDEQEKQLKEKDEVISNQSAAISQKDSKISDQNATISSLTSELEALRQQLAALQK